MYMCYLYICVHYVGLHKVFIIFTNIQFHPSYMFIMKIQTEERTKENYMQIKYSFESSEPMKHCDLWF